MALAKVQLIPGFDKQVTETGAEGRWIDGQYVRFRYGLPENSSLQCSKSQPE